MTKDFISIHTIVCHRCETKQTGIIRQYDAVSGETVTDQPEVLLPQGFFAIKCCKCYGLIDPSALNLIDYSEYQK
ncbi:MAG TPA: hypothetical protein VGB63_13175 [Pedobacter sp.]|jgi:hypothetical protein